VEYDGVVGCADPPGPPSVPTAQDVCKDSCELTWRAPEQDGGAPVTGYHVERCASGRVDRWIRITRQAVPDTRYKVGELVEGNEYQFRISAENSVGVGPAGPESDPIIAKDPWGLYDQRYSMLYYRNRFEYKFCTIQCFFKNVLANFYYSLRIVFTIVAFNGVNGLRVLPFQ